MITGELKNRIDSLWDTFAAGGLVNPLDVIEQITYLMFIRDLDDADNLRARESEMLGLPHTSIFAGEIEVNERKIEGRLLKWSVFHDMDADSVYKLMQDWVFPFIKGLDGDKESGYSKYMSDAIFKLPTALLLSKVIDALDEIYAMMERLPGSDIRGDVYEYLLSKIASSGLNGQFRTPRHIIRMMVEMMAPTPEDVICDPACGSAGFLISAGEYLKEKHQQEIFFSAENTRHYMTGMFHGYDMDRTMLRIGAMNMMTHGVQSPIIEYRDSLSDQNTDADKYSLILANPPFKGSLDYEIVSADLLKKCKTKKTELLFLALFLRMLRVGGRCACIVPDGVLFGSSTAHKAIRKEIIENNRLEAVISMPSGVFKPYAGVSTAVLVFTKTGHGGTDKVWFYDMRADGLSLDDKRTPVSENDIPDIIARFRSLKSLPLEGKVSAQPTDEVYNESARARTEQSFMVDKAEIAANDYDLSINKYKQTIYKQIEYPSSKEILADICEVNRGIAEAFEQLSQSLKDMYEAFEPIRSVQISMEELYKRIDKSWWTIVLEAKNEAEWNGRMNDSMIARMEGERGVQYIKQYIENKASDIRFSEALKCYDLGMFYSCACSLAVLIEKMLVQYDLVTSTRLKSRFENFVIARNPWVYAAYAIDSFQERYACDTRKSDCSFDKEEPDFLNRHWLLHGRMERRVTQFDCLQLICAVYVIMAIENDDLD